MTHGEANHSISYRHFNVRSIYLVVYIGNIVLTGSDHHDMSQVEKHLCHHF